MELFLNGQSLGVREMSPFSHVEWVVNYAPGTLSAKGYNAGGKPEAEDTVATTGAAAMLRLSTTRTSLSADGEDLTPIEVDVLDAQGRIVPTADNLVTFKVTGAGHVAGVGNGDAGDHDPDKADHRLQGTTVPPCFERMQHISSRSVGTVKKPCIRDSVRGERVPRTRTRALVGRANAARSSTRPRRTARAS